MKKLVVKISRFLFESNGIDFKEIEHIDLVEKIYIFTKNDDLIISKSSELVLECINNDLVILVICYK